MKCYLQLEYSQLSFNQQHYYLNLFYEYEFIDNSGEFIGEVVDLLLAVESMEVKSILISGSISINKYAVINLENIDIEKSDFKLNKVVLTINKKDLLFLKSPNKPDEEKEIYYSELKRYAIIDNNGHNIEQKITDVLVKKKEQFLLITNKNFTIPQSFIRSFQTNKKISVILSEMQLNTFKHDEIIFAFNQLQMMNVNNPNFEMIDKLIELGFSNDVYDTLNSIQKNNIKDNEIVQQIEFFRAKIMIYKGDINKAREIFETLRLTTKELLHTRIELEIGKLLFKTGEYKSSFEILEPTLPKFDKNKVFQSLTLNWIGLCLFNLGNVQKAMSFFDDAKKIAIETKNTRALAFSLNNIAMILREQGKITQSIELLEEGINYVKENSVRSMSILLRNLAMSHFQTGNQGKALEIFFDAFIIRSKFSNIIEICESLVDIAIIEYSLGKFDSESVSLKLFPPPPYSITIIEDYKDFITGLHEKQQKNYPQALKYFNKLLKRGIINLEYQVKIFEYLNEILLINWMQDDLNPDHAQNIVEKIQLGFKLTSRNNLISYNCKTAIGIAKMQIFMMDFEKAKFYYEKGLEIATKNGLVYHKKIIEKDLNDFEKIKKRFSLIDEELIIVKEHWINELIFYLRHLHVINLF